MIASDPGLQEAIETTGRPPLVVYHGHCDDGFTAAWVARKAMPDAEFRPFTYEMSPLSAEELAGREVYMLDFCPNTVEQLRQWVLNSRGRLALLDHHKTAKALVEEIELELGTNADVYASLLDCPPDLIFDMEKSGAMLAWEFFFPGVDAPYLVGYVQDRDLWKWQMAYSKEFSAYLRSFERTWDIWDMIDEAFGGSKATERMFDQGAAIVRSNARLVEEMMNRAVPCKILGYDTLIADAPFEFASEVAGGLALRLEAMGATSPFGMSVAFRSAPGKPGGSLAQFSLRSRGDFDVSAIAKKMGGGGHKNAAGFERVTPYPHLDLAVTEQMLCNLADASARPMPVGTPALDEDVERACSKLVGMSRSNRRKTLSDMEKQAPMLYKAVSARLTEIRQQVKSHRESF